MMSTSVALWTLPIQICRNCRELQQIIWLQRFLSCNGFQRIPFLGYGTIWWPVRQFHDFKSYHGTDRKRHHNWNSSSSPESGLCEGCQHSHQLWPHLKLASDAVLCYYGHVKRCEIPIRHRAIPVLLFQLSKLTRFCERCDRWSNCDYGLVDWRNCHGPTW